MGRRTGFGQRPGDVGAADAAGALLGAGQTLTRSVTRRARRRSARGRDARGQNGRGQNGRGRPVGAWLPDPVVLLRDGEWVVRPVAGAATAKVYRCPGCDHEINPGTAHLVVWPPDRVEDRRHWHRPCWDRRCRAARLRSDAG